MRTPPGGLCGRGRSLTAAVGSILLLHIVHHGLGGPLGLLHGADHVAGGEHAGASGHAVLISNQHGDINEKIS